MRVGSYEIQAPIGVGGMGEVYRAVDLELHRTVALKVLPDQFVKDAERVSRFEREATTLASLNHPNVAQIYGVVGGANETRALAMEFVDGEDLAARIRRGPLPLDEALPIARQIAAALEAAHEIGIVHRDLKPANVRVRPDGVVKVLDFGLARTILPPELSPAKADSPTVTAPAMTEPGVILGTAAYMSPEQASGRVVDRRCDIWSLGCVVFEMLSGQRPFAAETVTETLSAVLRDTPDWNRLPAATPSPIRRLLKRCLEKEPTRRLDSAAAVRIEIDETIAGSATEPVASVSSSSQRRPWLLAAVSAAIAIASIGAWLSGLRPSSSAPELRLDITTPGEADPYSFALSPDGTKIVFVSAGRNTPLQLWLRSFDTDTAVAVPNTEGAVYPFWSPDSQFLGFYANGKLKRVNLAGGAAVTLADAAAGRGASWGVNSQILFTQNASGAISVVSATGSGVRNVTSLAAGDAGHLSPVWHPDGRRFFSSSEAVIPNCAAFIWPASIGPGSPGSSTPMVRLNFAGPGTQSLFERARYMSRRSTMRVTL